MKYYLALKSKKILPHATTWMKLEDIRLSEISQSQKVKYPLVHGTRIVRFTKTESRVVVARG